MMLDVRVMARRLWCDRAFTAASIATMALTIGSVATVLTVVDGVALKPPPFQEPDRLVVVGRTDSSSPTGVAPTSLPVYLDWRDRNTVFEDVGAYQPSRFALGAPGVDAREVTGFTVTPSLFRLLGVGARLGRTLMPEDAAPGGDRVVVLSDGAWRSLFGGDPDIVGRALTLSSFTDTVTCQIVGVMPPGFALRYQGPESYYLPQVEPGDRSSLYRGGFSHTVYARLRPGVSIRTANLAMRDLGNRLDEEYPGPRPWSAARVLRLQEFLFGLSMRLVTPLLASVALLLLLGCANIAALSVARVTARRGELGIQLALGATGGRLMREVIAESVGLWTIGGVVGTMVALLGVALAHRLGAEGIPRFEQAAIDWRLACVALVLSVATGVIAGLVPALQLWSRELRHADAVRRATGTPGRARLSAQNVLAAAQLAVALALLGAGGLTLRSVGNLLRVDLGFVPEQTVAIRLRFQERYYGPGGPRLQQAIAAAAMSAPGATAVGWTSELPLSPPQGVRFTLPTQASDFATFRMVDTGYLNAVGASISQGRWLNRDDETGAPAVVVDESFAKRYFPDGRVVGQRIYIDDWREVVGVVADVQELPLTSAKTPTLYWPFSGRHWMAGAPWLVVRTTAREAVAIDSLRSLIRRTDPGIPVIEVTTLESRVTRELSQLRFLATTLAVFAFVSLAIAAAGIYGLTAHTAARRTRELGIRIALGATPGRLQAAMVRDTATLVVTGTVAGVACLWWGRAWLNAWLFGVPLIDWVSLAGAMLLLSLAGLGAAFLAARRAARAGTMEAIRLGSV